MKPINFVIPIENAVYMFGKPSLNHQTHHRHIPETIPDTVESQVVVLRIQEPLVNYTFSQLGYDILLTIVR